METVAPTEKPPVRRRWRWTRRLLISGLSIAITLRVCIGVFLPGILDNFAKDRGLSIQYEKLDFSILTGSLELWKLEVRTAPEPQTPAVPGEPQEEGELLTLLEFLEADVEVAALLRGDLVVRRAEIDGLDVHANRESIESGWSLASALPPSAEPEPADEEEEEPDQETGEEDSEFAGYDLSLPLELRAVRLQHLQLHLRDGAQDPPFETRMELNVRLTDLGLARRPARMEIFAHGTRWLDAMKVEGRFQSQGTELNATFAARVRGLHVGRLGDYLTPLGLLPRANSLDMGMTGEVQTRGVDGGDQALALDASLKNIELLADGEECLALDELRLSLPHISPGQVQIETSLLRGVRGEARRTADGGIQLAGLQFVGLPEDPTGGTAEQDLAEVAEGPSTEAGDALDAEVREAELSEPAPSPFDLRIAALRLEDSRFTFRDETLVPPRDLQWQIVSAELEDIQLQPGHAIQLRAAMHSPEIFEELELTGTLVPLGPAKTVDLSLAMGGIRPERVRPYLAAMGLQSTFESGSFGANLNAELLEESDGLLHANLQVRDIVLSDSTELFAIDELGLKGLRYNPVDGSLHLAEVLWQGTRVSARRDTAGNLHVFGLATGAAQEALVAEAPAPRTAPLASKDPAQPRAAEGEPREATGTPAPPANLPPITIERIAWLDTTFDFLDRSFQPARELHLADLGFELRGLELGGEAGGTPRPPAAFKLWFQADGLAQELQAEGTLQTQPGPLDVHLQASCRGRELSYAALAPWLSELGLEPQLQSGELDMGFQAHVAQTAAGLKGNLELSDLRFVEGEDTYLALEALSLPGWELGNDGLVSQGLTVRGPLLDVQRDEEGALLALGLRVLPAPETSNAQETESADAIPQAPSNAPGSTASEDSEPSAPEENAFALDLGTITLDGAQVHWNDRAIPGGVDTTLRLGLEFSDLRIGPGVSPTPFALSLGAEGGLGDLKVEGELGLAPERFEVTSSITMSDIRAGVFAPYFPAGVSMPLEDGRFGANVSAFFAPRLTGDGFAIGLTARDIDYRSAASESPLFAIGNLSLDAPRLDPDGAHFDLAEVQLQGLELDTRRKPDGSLHLLGLALGVPGEESAMAPTTAEPEEAAAQARPAQRGIPVEAAATAPLPVPRKQTTPTVTLGALDVGVAHLRFLDEMFAEAQPFDGSVRLQLPGPTTLIAPETAELAPIEFLVDGFATPIVEELAAKLVLTPYATEPGLALEFSAGGLRGSGITEILPELAELLDGTDLEGGRFETRLETHLEVRRRSPVDFDLSTGFGLGVALERFSFVPRPDAEELLGLEHLDVVVKSLRPGSGAVHVERIELVKPKLHLRKSEEGLHLLGLTLKIPGTVSEDDSEPGAAPGEDGGGDAPAEDSPADQEEVASTESAPSGNTQPAQDSGPAVFRLDEFLISGADLSFVDESTEPAMHLPVSDVDMELKRFSTRTLTNPEPFRFRVALYGGDIQLPKREAAGNLLGGILGSVGSLIDGDEELELEGRPVFDEILLRGNLSLGPDPKGWTQLRVRALELPTFRGPALQSGIEIGDGLLNETAMLHFDGKGGMRVSSNTNISYLSLSEPADGPISSYLKLPAPIDTVLYVLRDEKGDQNIPLNLVIAEGGITAGAILSTVGETLAMIIGDAIASSPMKIIGGVIDLAGLEDEPLELSGDELLEIPFHAGDVQAPRDIEAQVAPLLQLLRDDPSLYLVVTHQLSASDLACCDVLANPPAEECLGLAQNLRRKRVRLLASRAEEAAAVRGAYAMGDPAAADRSRAALRQLDLEIGATEAALDRVFELTRPGAERGRARRARGTALEVADRRMEAVTRVLLRAPIPSIGTRVDARRPRFGVTPDLERGTVKITVHRRL